MRICRILNGFDKPEDTWAEKFYTSNIAFVGFGLPECETDIWWLLTHRAYLYYTNYHGIRDKLQNRITFYDILDVTKKENSEEEARRVESIKKQERKHFLLRNMHVEVKTKSLSSGELYENKYREIFEEISGGFWNAG